MRTHATHSCFLVYLCYIFLLFFFFSLLENKTKQKKVYAQPSALIEGVQHYTVEGIVSLCSYMPVKNDHIHSTQLLGKTM